MWNSQLENKPLERSKSSSMLQMSDYPAPNYSVTVSVAKQGTTKCPVGMTQARQRISLCVPTGRSFIPLFQVVLCLAFFASVSRINAGYVVKGRSLRVVLSSFRIDIVSNLMVA
jgi:hypothetical protein